jgi:Zn-dependent peptidase ImmA (M78 family)
MSFYDYRAAADRVFRMAHRFLYDYKIRWLPVDIKEIAMSNWSFKWSDKLAWEIGQTNDYVCRHVLQSYDGATFCHPNKKEYEIILNQYDSDGSDRLPERIAWTCAHEVGHIYLGHFESNGVSCLAKSKIPQELYAHLEFEADLFAGEVLASKWLMRDIGVTDESQIAMLCGISDPAALARYRKATVDYSFIPMNVIVTRQNFGEYLKEITICRTLEELADVDVGDVSSFARLNTPKVLLPAPKPKFLRRPGDCPFCDGEFDATSDPTFCIYCGKPLKKGLTTAAEPCGEVNPKDAAYCGKCGNRVNRIRQGFCFAECEI